MSGASEPSHGEKPAPGRLSFFRHHLFFILLFLAATPLTAAFCAHPVLASLGDDSVSYLTLARYLSPFASDPLLEPWTKYVAHFPPLFPLFLALTGAAGSIFASHLAVAACALGALVLVYVYAERMLDSRLGASLIALLFLMAPGTWISILGIMSEPLFLALTLALLIRMDDTREQWTVREAFAVALLMAAVLLTRAAGVAMVVAYAVQVALASVSRRRLPSIARLAPLAVPAAAQLAWNLAKPHPDHEVYGVFLGAIADRWMHDPDVFTSAWGAFFGGWIATFTAESHVGAGVAAAFGALGALGLAGAAMRAAKNRLDGWYVLASVAMLFIYTFPEAQMRRLLYPLVPLVFIHAALALRALAGRFASRAALASWALAAVLTLPATILVAQRSLNREPLLPGLAYSAASTSDYYTTINESLAKAAALQNAVTLAGLELSGRVAPEGSRIMWTRTEYVALLSRRAAVALSTRWSEKEFAQAVVATKVDYVAAARLFKSDLDGLSGDSYTRLVSATPAFLHPVLAVPGAVGPDDFVLFAVDRAVAEREARSS